MDRFFPFWIVLALIALLLATPGENVLWPTLAVLAITLGAISWQHRRGRVGEGRARALEATLLLLLIYSSIAGLALSSIAARDDGDWARRARGRLDTGAQQVRELLTELEASARERAEDALEPDAELKQLAQPIRMGDAELEAGVSLWREGAILRWAGRVPGPERLEPQARPLLVDYGFYRYLTVSSVDDEGLTAYLDVGLGANRELFPRMGLGQDPAEPLSRSTGLSARVLVSAPRPDEVLGSFERVVAVPEEDPWIWVVLRASSAREERRESLRNGARSLAWALLASCFLAGALAWRQWAGRRYDRRSILGALLLAVLVVAFRVGVDRARLLELAFATELGPTRWLLEPAYFATTWGFGLMRSVLDFLLTALCLGFVALLILPAWLHFIEKARARPARLFCYLLLLASSIFAMAWIASLQEVVAQNANPKLIGLDAPFFTFPFGVLHLAMLLTLLAPSSFAYLGWERWQRGSERAKGGVLLAGLLLAAGTWFLVPGGSALVAWALLLPILGAMVSRAVRHPSFSVRVVGALVLLIWLSAVQSEGLRRVYRELKENVATERALDRLHPRHNWRRVLVDEFLKDMAGDPAMMRRLADPRQDRSNVAFELWAGQSNLSAVGFGSRIVLFDGAGRAISDFDLGLPYQPQPARVPATIPYEDDPWAVELLTVPTEHGKILVYRGWLDIHSIFPGGDASWLRVDLPYGATDPAVPIEAPFIGSRVALGFGELRGSLLPRQEFERPVIMGRLGETSVIAATDPALVGLARLSLDADGAWTQVSREGEPYRARLVEEEGESLVVAFALPTPRERLLDTTRLVALYLLAGALGLFLLLVALGVRPGRGRWPTALGHLGYQERLLGAIVVLVLLPVIVFGVFQTRRAETLLRRTNMEEVSRRLDTALRLLTLSLDEAHRARTEAEPLRSWLAGTPTVPDSSAMGSERGQVMLFDASGMLILDETGRDLDTLGQAELLAQVRASALVLESDADGWYLGRYYEERDADGRALYLYLRRPLHDESLGLVSRTVGADLTLFDGAWAVVSSRDDLFKAGLVAPVLPEDADHLLRGGGSPRYVTTEPGKGLVVARGYASIGGLEDPRRGVLAARLFTEATEAALEQRRSYLFLFGLSSLAFLLATAVGLFVAARTVGPIQTLVAGTRRVGAGDLAVRLPEKGDDEIGQLMRSFNAMTEDLERGQQSLASRRSFLEALLGGLSAGVLVLDDELVVVESNNAADQLGERGLEMLLTQLRGLEPALEVIATEVVLEDGEGSRTLRSVLSPIQLEGGEAGWLLLFDDVSELLASRRLAVYAEMARQVAHEVKNPLTPIQLAAQMVRQACRDDHPRMSEIVESNVEQIERQVGRLREIASEFSLLGRTDPPEMEPVAVDGLLVELRLLYPSPDGRLEVTAHGGEGLHILANRESMLKVLTNLLENAVQAMEQKGRIELVAEREGERVLLKVRDEGGGISEELQDRLFEAYFSTKSYGTGLGLVICRNLTEKMGGRISLANRTDGQGAEAVVDLPLHHLPSA